MRRVLTISTKKCIDSYYETTINFILNIRLYQLSYVVDIPRNQPKLLESLPTVGPQNNG